MKTEIRSIQLKDEKRWRELWLGYCQFYKMNLPEENIRYLWNRIHDQNSSVFGICAVDDNEKILGLAHYVLHESTTQLQPICCLQDLFVDQSGRNNGVGYQLIEWLMLEMKTKGWGRVYWHTRENNYKARSLYDKLSSHNEFLRYTVDNPIK